MRESVMGLAHCVSSTCVFFNKLFLSLLNILWPYRGQYVLVASFVLCQHDQGKHPLGLSLSFFISLSSSFHPPFFTLPPAFSSSFTLTPSWFCLFFPVSEMKASPQLLSVVLKRPKWGSLSDESPHPPRQTEIHTFIHTCMQIHMSC